jgi:hypothetical protein
MGSHQIAASQADKSHVRALACLDSMAPPKWVSRERHEFERREFWEKLLTTKHDDVNDVYVAHEGPNLLGYMVISHLEEIESPALNLFIIPGAVAPLEIAHKLLARAGVEHPVEVAAELVVPQLQTV